MAPVPTSELEDSEGRLCMTWAAMSADMKFTNFGDALSPVIVAMMSGKRLRKASFQSRVDRIAAVGTIGQNFTQGRVHYWGTGFDAAINILDRSLRGYVKPPSLEPVVHALRGKQSAALLRSHGVAVPDVFGDPVWFMPRFYPFEHEPKRYELGVVLHMSELAEKGPAARPKPEMQRYHIPDAWRDSVTIINTFADRSLAGLERKLAEIVACKRIVSMSLHGLVVAETYGIPCAWFGFFSNQRELRLSVDDNMVDHRVADFYSGAGRQTVNAYLWHRNQAVKWDEVIAGVDRLWSPLDYDGHKLFDAFPVKRAVDFRSPRWPVDADLLTGINL